MLQALPPPCPLYLTVEAEGLAKAFMRLGVPGRLRTSFATRLTLYLAKSAGLLPDSRAVVRVASSGGLLVGSGSEERTAWLCTPAKYGLGPRPAKNSARHIDISATTLVVGDKPRASDDLLVLLIK